MSSVAPRLVPMAASETDIPSKVSVELPAPIRRVLDVVKRRIRRHALFSGLLFLVCVAGTIFWSTIIVDAGWFALQKLELPVGLRAIFLAVLLPTLLWIVGSQILMPVFRRLRDADIALLLERRFPQFQDRLITTVESAVGFPADGPLVHSMLQRTVSEAEALVSGVDAEKLFDTRIQRRLMWLSAMIGVSVALYSLISPDVLSRWYSAFIRCDEVYHIRSTALDVAVIAQPGDRQKSFTVCENGLVYRHPRGTDLELELKVPQRAETEGPPWVVPDRVRIDVIRQDGSRSRAYVSASGEGLFRFLIARLQEPVELEFLAGDYRSTERYSIEPVNLPSVDSVRLDCQFPEYTGWNQLRETSLAVLGSEVSLPQGTSFELQATSSKPLQSVRIITDWFEVSGDREQGRIIPREGILMASSTTGGLISADGMQITAQFSLISERLPVDRSDSSVSGERFDEGNPEQSTANPNATETTVWNDASLPIASNSSVRFFLHDEDDVMSINPESLRIRGIPDEPPVIEVRGSGIDNAITRLAKIPITGRVSDDYGVMSAGFQFVVDDATTWRPRPFRRAPQAGTLDFQLSREPNVAVEIFDVQPLELSDGQTLTLAVVAEDGNVATGPGVTRSEPMVFRIVSNEELLSLLYTREIALRRRFEEVIAQLEQVRDDLVFHQSAAERLDSNDASLVKAEDGAAVLTCATRSANTLRRQTNELDSISDGFEGIIEQLLNNSIPPQQLAENMRRQILQPMRDAGGQPMADADRVIGNFRVAAMDRSRLGPLVTESADRVSDVITQLKLILENVRDMAEFHEALRDLKAILEEQQKLLEETRALQKRNLIDKLKLLE